MTGCGNYERVTREAWRVEPIPCGERQWLEDETSPIIEIARREGFVVSAQPNGEVVTLVQEAD